MKTLTKLSTLAAIAAAILAASVSMSAQDPAPAAALGDFNPAGNEYYGLDFDTSLPGSATFLVVINLKKDTVTTVGQTIDDLHVIAFVRHLS
jgi:hypothetical protein